MHVTNLRPKFVTHGGLAEIDRRRIASPIREMQALHPPLISMRFEFIPANTATIICDKIVKLNYGNHLVLSHYENSTYLCIFDDQEEVIAFLGFCKSPMDDRYVEIFSLNTHPEHQKKGYATTLLGEIYSHFCGLGEDVRLLLTCDKINEAFYQKREYSTLACTKGTCIMIRTNG